MPCFIREGLKPTSCVLCGLEKVPELLQSGDTLCSCPTSIGCKDCEIDIISRENSKVSSPAYKCAVHGEYRTYEDGLLRYKVLKLKCSMCEYFRLYPHY